MPVRVMKRLTIEQLCAIAIMELFLVIVSQALKHKQLLTF